MEYKAMIEAAVKNGGGEKTMWKAVEAADQAMEYIRKNSPQEYDCLLRSLYVALCGKHYNRELAEQDTQAICYTDAGGNERHGAYWTAEQIESATQGKSFSNSTTLWDKYVAYNAAYADFCKKFDDEQVMDIAYLFFFADEDWKGENKVWEYMSANC